jgi:hypothetical protein
MDFPDQGKSIMKKLSLVSSILVLILITGISSCFLFDKEGVEFWFANMTSSEYALTSFQIQDSSGFWNDSLIPTGEAVNPGEYFVFPTDLQSGDEANYRVGVTYNSATVYLDTWNDEPIVIFPWSHDPRYAEVCVLTDADGPYVSGYGNYDYSWDDSGSYTQVGWQ